MASKPKASGPQPSSLDEAINKLATHSLRSGRPLSAADMAFLRRQAPAAYEKLVWWQAEQHRQKRVARQLELLGEKMAKEDAAEQKKRERREQVKDWAAKIAERLGLKEEEEMEMVEVTREEYLK